MERLLLIVEDDEDNAEALCMILEGKGYQVIVARDGLESLRLASERRPDLILMDLGLPSLNGVDAVRYLRHDPATARIPVVALTASWLGRESGILRESGFAGALRKPCQPAVLLAELERVMQPQQGS